MTAILGGKGVTGLSRHNVCAKLSKSPCTLHLAVIPWEIRTFRSYLFFFGGEAFMEQIDRYVNDIVAAKIIDSSPQTLRNWRHLGRGPAYSKRGRMVRYKVQDLLNYMAAGRVDPEARREG